MKKLIFCLLFILSPFYFATAQQDGDYGSVTSGAWNSLSTWKQYKGTGWIDPTVIPSELSTVYIQSGHQVTLNKDESCKDLNIFCSSGTGVSIGAFVLVLYGYLRSYTGTYPTIAPTTSILLEAISSTEGIGKLKVVGNTRKVTETGRWSGNNTINYDIEFAGNVGSIFTMETSFKARSISVLSGKLLITNNVDLRPDAGSSGTGSLIIKTGASLEFNSGTVNIRRISSSDAISHFGTFTVESGGTLEFSGTSSPVIGASTINFNGNVIYSGAGQQTLVTKGENTGGVNPSAYYHLTLSGSAAKLLGLNTTINGTKNISGTASLNLNSKSLSYGSSAILEYSGNSAQTTTDNELPSSNGPSNIIISNSSGITLHADRTISGILTLTSGALNISGKTLTFINGNTPIERTNGTITTGSATNIVFGTVGNTGGSAFTIPAGTFTSTPSINNLTINRINSLTLGQDMTINGTLALTSGLLNTGSNTISFGTSAMNPAETSLGRIIGNATMNTRTIGTSALSEFLGFAMVSGSEDIGNLSFTRVTGDAGIIISGSAASIKNYWSISITGSQPSSGRNVTFKWLSDLDNNKSWGLGLLAGAFRNDGSSWVQVGNYTNVSTSNPRSLTVSTTQFSQWTISDNNLPLPVNLLSLSSVVINNNVRLYWIANSENNNSGFDVERKTLSGTYTKIGFVKGKGTVNTPSSYSYEDKNLQTGKYKYRLRQIDYNGNFEYFELTGEVEVGVPNKFSISQNYPNPFNPVTKINFNLPADSKVTLVICDVTGREVAKLLNNEFRSAGYHTTEFNASKFASGVYFYSFTATNFRMTKKMIIMR